MGRGKGGEALGGGGGRERGARGHQCGGYCVRGGRQRRGEAEGRERVRGEEGDEGRSWWSSS